MLEIDRYVAFETLKLLFEPKLASLIENFEPDSVKLIGNLDDSTAKSLNKGPEVSSKLKQTIYRFMNVMKNKLQAQMLGLIYYCGKENEDYHNLMYYMLANLCVHLGFSLPDEIIEECIIYILKHPRDIPTWEKIKRKIDEKDQDEEGDFLVEERSALVLELMRKIEGKVNKSKYDTFSALASVTDL